MTLKKKIFITGASSELMAKFISFIKKDKYAIFCLSRNKKNKKNTHIRWIKGDIQSPEEYKDIIKTCDIIIHAAAVTHSSGKQKYFDVNFAATKKLLDIALEYKIKKFIFISSRAAGFKSGAYGKSKILAEEYIKENFDNWLIFRPSEIFGGSKNEGIQKMIYDIKLKKNIVCPINIPSKLYPIFIDDAARIMYNCTFEKPIKNKIITINGKIGFSYTELAKFTAENLRKKIRIIPIPKFIMFFLKIIIEILPVNTGISPDQINRLYSKKNTDFLNYDYFKLEDYFKNL